MITICSSNSFINVSPLSNLMTARRFICHLYSVLNFEFFEKNYLAKFSSKILIFKV